MILRSTRSLGILLVAVALSASALDDGVRQLLASGRINDVLSVATARIEHSPHDTDAYLLAAQAYLAIEDWDKALENSQRAVTFAPDNSDYHMWLGRVYGQKAEHSSIFSKMGWAKKARRELERAVELNPANVGARSDLTEFYIDAPGLVGGGVDKARGQIDALLKLDAAVAHSMLARIADKDNDRPRAERELRAAIDSTQDKARYWIELAAYYEKWKRTDDMEKTVNTAMAAPRVRTDVIFYAGEILFRNNRNFPRAEELLRQYLAAPDEEVPAFRAHYLLGQLFEKQGRKPDAAREYRSALALVPDYKSASDALRRIQ